MLKDEKAIVLTHNFELVKLLHEQHQYCFSLYMLAALKGELNGFEPVNRNEIGLLLYTDKSPKLLIDQKTQTKKVGAVRCYPKRHYLIALFIMSGMLMSSSQL